eukprot:scaffold691_cov181-Ochromonas_danica.AAC.6
MIRDLLGEERTEYLLAEIQPFVENLQELGWNEIKPWGEFFATFKAPQWNVRHLEQRLLWSALYAVLLCGLHLLFRPRNVSSKVNRMYEEAKLNGYGGLFNLHLPGESKFDSKVDDDMLEAPYVTEEDYDSKFGGDLHHRKRGSGGSGKYSEY